MVRSNIETPATEWIQKMTVTLGYTILYVENVRKTLEFYEKAFELKRKMLTPEGDYGELETGETTLAFVAHGLAESNLSNAGGFTPVAIGSPPPAMSITLVTSDVQATVRAAIDAGARSYVDPTEKPWGQTVAYVVDPSGFLLEIATAVGQ